METVITMPEPGEKFTNIRIYSGSSNTGLSKLIAKHIHDSFKESVPIFHSVHIITPNKAQHNWLKEQLATELGFIANLEQHNLKGFFKDLISELSPDAKVKEGIGKLVWNLFTELGKEEFKIKFPKIGDYCGADEIKRLALAQIIAGLFQDYEQYRPDLIKNWKEGAFAIPESEHEKWQMYLYNATGFRENYLLPEEFGRLVEQNQELIKNYRFLYIFGDVIITPLQLEYLKVLSKVKGLHIHIFRCHLGLERKENPLAENWGELAALTDEALNKLATLPEKKELSISAETNLEKIQQDILQDSNTSNLQKDNSFLIYNSFTRVREVEALYNYLVKTVDEASGQLGARDFAVYVPNLNNYIPAIKTVFDTAPHEFPYTLVTKGFSREDSFWTALEQILSFDEENFTASAVFNLLEMQPIQNSFGFKDLKLLRKAFQDANIRREYEGDDELETNYTSFSYGLRRLIYGFCLGEENVVEIDEAKVWPVDIAEGAQAQDLFRLNHLVELLQQLLQKKKEKRTTVDWQMELMQIAEEFLKPEEWQEERFRILIENLVSLETSEEEVSFNTFFYRLKDHLQNQDLQQVRGRGGIVFSGLYPGVSMPKKVIAFLGLNFEEFPRKSHTLNFDLLKEEDKPGSRVEDRGAFLQVLLDAGEKVLLSYIGQNVKDNSEIPPSSLISVLKDYAEKRGQKIKEIIHPLHAFNSAYFDTKNEDLFTYNGAGKERKLEKHKKDISIPEEINLYELENFLKDPFKHHYNKVLGIYYENPELLPEWECFDLDNLQEWTVKDKLKAARLEGEKTELEELRKKMLLKSEIPLKNVGRSKITETEEKIAALWEKVEEIRKGRTLRYFEDNIHFDLADGQKINLKIKLEVLDEDGLFLIVSKKDKLKYELSAYIRAITLRVLEKEGVLHYLCFDGDIPYYQEIRVEVTPEVALEELKFFMELFRKNYYQILPFYPELNLKVNDLKGCNEKEGQEPPETIKELIDNRFEDWKSFFPSDYFIREYQQGFFSGAEGKANLLNLQLRTIEITQKINKAFNKNE